MQIELAFLDSGAIIGEPTFAKGLQYAKALYYALCRARFWEAKPAPWPRASCLVFLNLTAVWSSAVP